MLEIKNLDVSFGDKKLLTDISLTVAPGARHLLSGHNGSGKSTLLKLMLGLNKVQQGEIFLFGEKINKFKIVQIKRNIV